MYPTSLAFYSLTEPESLAAQDPEVPKNAVIYCPGRLNLLQSAVAGLGSGLIWCGEQLKRIAVPAVPVETNPMTAMITSNR